jgi:hypothetical protein
MSQQPATIKGWRERAGLPPEYELSFPTAVEQALVDEVAELRARLGLENHNEEGVSHA